MGQKLMADRLHKERKKRIIIKLLTPKKMENYHLENFYQRKTFVGTAKLNKHPLWQKCTGNITKIINNLFDKKELLQFEQCSYLLLHIKNLLQIFKENFLKFLVATY